MLTQQPQVRTLNYVSIPLSNDSFSEDTDTEIEYTDEDNEHLIWTFNNTQYKTVYSS